METGTPCDLGKQQVSCLLLSFEPAQHVPVIKAVNVLEVGAPCGSISQVPERQHEQRPEMHADLDFKMMQRSSQFSMRDENP